MRHGRRFVSRQLTTTRRGVQRHRGRPTRPPSNASIVSPVRCDDHAVEVLGSRQQVHVLDKHRDEATVARVHRLAAEVAAAHGGDISRMRRATGYSNATWVGGGIAVRISCGPTEGVMASEAALIVAAPAGVGHPPLIAVGASDGWEWMVTREVSGRNLQDAWPSLSSGQRAHALRRLWQRAEAFHDAGAALAPHLASQTLFVPPTVEAAHELATSVAEHVGFVEQRAERLHELIRDLYAAAGEVPHVPVHGDLAVVNAIWDDRDVVALLDLEFATLAPVELDLARLVWEAQLSERWPLPEEALVGVVRSIAPRVAHPRHGRTLLLGYAALSELTDLATWLRGWDGLEDVTTWKHYVLLTDLLADGGAVEPVLRSLR